jgi:hypothetical protein
MFACEKNSWERLIFNHNIGIRFIIFQVDVKPWLKVFDQRIFKEECILFGIYDREFDMMYPVYKFMGFIAGKIL